MRFGLDERILERIRGILSAHPAVERALIYGSRAKGCHKPGSDIDLCLQGDHVSSLDRDRILLEVDDLDLPYSMDITVFSQITQDSLREHIQRVGVVLWER